MKVIYSFDGMHFRYGHLEVSYTDSVISAFSELFCSIIHSIEFTDFVSETNFFK